MIVKEDLSPTGALWMAETMVFKNNGDRPNIPDILILMTDGQPTIAINQLPDQVGRVKNDGIRIIGIGVSKAVSVIGYCIESSSM